MKEAEVTIVYKKTGPKKTIENRRCITGNGRKAEMETPEHGRG